MDLLQAAVPDQHKVTVCQINTQQALVTASLAIAIQYG